jgi:hypothetical protein
MIPRIAGLIVLALTQWQSLSAAQVNYSNLPPQNAIVDSLKTDAIGNIYVAGPGDFSFSSSAFVAKIASDGVSLLYNTFVGLTPVGGQSVGVRAMAVSPDGFVYVANFFIPQPGAPCCFGTTSITRLDPSGNILQYSLSASSSATEQTFINSIQDMTTDAAGNLYATGVLGNVSADNPQSSGFTYKMDSGLNILWSATYGGSYIAVDKDGNAYVVGVSTQPIPTTPNAFQSSFAGLNDSNFPGCGTVEMACSAFPILPAHIYM